MWCERLVSVYSRFCRHRFAAEYFSKLYSTTKICCYYRHFASLVIVYNNAQHVREYNFSLLRYYVHFVCETFMVEDNFENKQQTLPIYSRLTVSHHPSWPHPPRPGRLLAARYKEPLVPATPPFVAPALG